jgi:hypothetical protein
MTRQTKARTPLLVVLEAIGQPGCDAQSPPVLAGMATAVSGQVPTNPSAEFSGLATRKVLEGRAPLPNLRTTNELPPLGLAFTVPIRIWEPNETNFADG